MRYDHRWVKQRFAVNSSTWTPITPAYDFNYLSLKCLASDLLLRTDPDDADTEDTLQAGVQESVTTAFIMRIGSSIDRRRARFENGEPVCYVKSVAASATVIVTWLL